MNKNYNNIGFISKNSNKQYELYRPTSQVLSYTRDILDKEIDNSGKIFSQRLSGEVKIKEKESQTEYVDFSKPVFLEEQFRYKIGN